MHSNMNSNKKLWWSKLKLSRKGKSRKDGEDEGLSRKLNVNEEYKEVFRTKSYTEIWSKVQVQLKGSLTTLDHRLSTSSSFASPPSFSSSINPATSSSPLPFYMHLSECLLEPRQEAAIDIVKSSKLQTLFVDYFEASLEACNICESLLRGIHKARSNHRLIKRAISQSRGGGLGGEGNYYMNDQCRELMMQELDTFARRSNPLSIINNGTMDLNKIHDKYAILLQRLTSRRRKIRRREKIMRFCKKAASCGFTIIYTIIVVTMLALAMHSVVGLLGLPGLAVALPMGVIKKEKGTRGTRASFLESLASQLDVAAKGVYILINDFDTVGRIVRRLHDEVEHMRALAMMCVRNKKSPEVVREALRELRSHEDGFVEQLEELEEHIYLCFLTINRSRRLVIQEILSP